MHLHNHKGIKITSAKGDLDRDLWEKWPGCIILTKTDFFLHFWLFLSTMVLEYVCIQLTKYEGSEPGAIWIEVDGEYPITRRPPTLVHAISIT